MRARLSLSATLACVLVLCACDGPGVAGPGTVRLARSGTSDTATTSIVGNWERVVFFQDEFGFSHATETFFQFNGDGSVVRTQTERNVTLGIADSVVTNGRWTLTGTQLLIDFTTPPPFQLTLQATIVGNELTLSGETFLRVLN